MKNIHVKLRDLQYLEAVAQCQHFGKAAQSCHVSQPTLSGQIMKLEQQLGLQLIERHRRAVLLTPAGRELVDQARQVLIAANRFETAADALKDPFAGEMHLGLIPTLAPYLLPHIMGSLKAELPRLDFFLYELQTEQLLSRLESGELDSLILPWLEGMDCFERFDLFDEELLLAVYDEHPLASIKKKRLSDLEGHHVLTLEDGHCLKDQALDYCFSAGAEEDDRFQATSLETLRYMVASGTGITLFPKLATMSGSSVNGIKYRRFAAPVPLRKIVLLVRPSYTRLQAVRKIVAAVRKAIKPVLAYR